MFLPLFLIWMGWILWTASTRGPREGLWRGWLLALLLLPVWLVKGLGSVTLDFRTGAALAGIGGFLVSENERLRYRFALMDLLVLLLFAVQVISGFVSDEITAMTIPEIMRRWLLPYMVGRVFMASYEDLSRFLPVVAVILATLSAYAFVEAGLHVNPFCKLLGKSYPILEAGEGYRWGIKRAQGPLDHPIFYGLMLVMAYPFAVEAGRAAWRRQGPRWWLLLPVSVLVAVGCTASRGAIIAAIATVYATLALASERFRVALIVLAVASGYAGYIAKDQIKSMLTAAVETGENERYVEIEGKEYRYTGTAHRELLFLVYGRAIRECPFFGYGARLADVPVDPHLEQRFSSIDNHYLLFYLQRGIAGLSLFIGITLLGLAYLIRMAWNSNLPHAALSGSMAGALLGVSALLASVWFAPDHGTVWLFFVGLATCLWTLDSETVCAAPPLSSRRLVPGHAPIR